MKFCCEFALAVLGGRYTPDEAKRAKTVMFGFCDAAGKIKAKADATHVVLGVLTPRWAAVWMAGDGYFGLGGSGELPEIGLGEPAGRLMMAKSRSSADWRLDGAEHMDGPLRGTLPGCLRGARPSDGMRLRAVVDGGRADHVYVATDGLRNEPGAEALLRGGPVCSRPALRAACVRPGRCDDLAIAFAGPRFGRGVA